MRPNFSSLCAFVLELTFVTGAKYDQIRGTKLGGERTLIYPLDLSPQIFGVPSEPIPVRWL